MTNTLLFTEYKDPCAHTLHSRGATGSSGHPISLFLPLLQVFLELCKEQEWDNSDEEVDLSVKWKLLPEEP